MNAFDWQAFLQQWSNTVLSSDDVSQYLPQEVIEAGYLGYPGATEEQIRQTEARLGMSLPHSYRSFLRASNGWQSSGSFMKELWPVENIEWFSVRHQPWIDAYAFDLKEDSQPSLSDEEPWPVCAEREYAMEPVTPPHPATVTDLLTGRSYGQIWIGPEDRRHTGIYLPVLQLRCDDVPELLFPDDSDLFQLVWCPRLHEDDYQPRIRNRGRIERGIVVGDLQRASAPGAASEVGAKIKIAAAPAAHQPTPHQFPLRMAHCYHYFSAIALPGPLGVSV